jgi:hypothetical protein
MQLVVLESALIYGCEYADLYPLMLLFPIVSLLVCVTHYNRRFFSVCLS